MSDSTYRRSLEESDLYRKQMVGARCGAGDGESVSWAQSFQFGKMRKFSRWMVGMVAQ